MDNSMVYLFLWSGETTFQIVFAENCRCVQENESSSCYQEGCLWQSEVTMGNMHIYKDTINMLKRYVHTVLYIFGIEVIAVGESEYFWK